MAIVNYPELSEGTPQYFLRPLFHLVKSVRYALCTLASPLVLDICGHIPFYLSHL